MYKFLDFVVGKFPYDAINFQLSMLKKNILWWQYLRTLTGQSVVQRMGKPVYTLTTNYNIILFMNLFLHTAKKIKFRTEPDLCSTDIIWNPLCDNVNVFLWNIAKQNG